jgi:hypothetical protein
MPAAEQQGVGHAGFAAVYPMFHVMDVEPLLVVAARKTTHMRWLQT